MTSSASPEGDVVGTQQAAGPAAHWEQVYVERAPEQVSWYQERPGAGLRLLLEAVPVEGAVVDVGAGAGTLVDGLLEAGFRDVTLLDLSQAALEAVRARLGEAAEPVRLVAGDLLAWEPDRQYAGWHDRAVLHFLVDEGQREAYVALAARAVAPGGAIVLGTFAEDGPQQCSGLPTARYDVASLAALFAPEFALEQSAREVHVTPWGAEQPFTWVVLRRLGG